MLEAGYEFPLQNAHPKEIDAWWLRNQGRVGELFNLSQDELQTSSRTKLCYAIALSSKAQSLLPGSRYRMSVNG